VGDDVRARATDVLRHAVAWIGYLRSIRLATQLLNNLHDLVHAGGTHGMAACLESTAGGHGYLAGMRSL